MRAGFGCESMIQASRRAILGGAAGGLLGFLGLRAARSRGHAGPLFVGCQADARDQHHVTGFDQAGQACFSLPLPERGHAMAFHPARPHMVVFARRPGRFAVVIDDDEGIALYRIDAAPGRHFYGHGTYSPDGRLLFATENDYEIGQGIVGVYDAGDAYKRVGEFPSHGIGPHELIMMPDGKTLAIANGGIRTHPDHDRAKLNLDSMAPTLVFTDSADGRHLDQATLPNRQHQLSIRHLATLYNGCIAIAMQYEGPKTDEVPLVAIHDGSSLKTLKAPNNVQRRMRHYGGSVAVDHGGALIAVSAPRGNLITFWDGLNGLYLTSVELRDGCGVAPTNEPSEFMLTGGEGDIRLVRPLTGEIKPVDMKGLASVRWDNHLRRA